MRTFSSGALDMTHNLPYGPRMRQSERVTSPLAVPLALSSAIFVVLLVLTTTPRVIGLPHVPAASREVARPHEPSAVTTSTTSITRHQPTVFTPRGSPSLPTTSSPIVPLEVSPREQPLIASGTVSGGAMSISYQPIAGPQTVQLISGIPVALSVWDGDCAIDSANQIIRNSSPNTCTVQIQSDTYTTWQLIALA